ncbi:MAG: TRAP transporter large permease [Opitutales bacterium]|jgi:tripartite ATP-independent transporter DctM subunit|nr:TRAP transporter large permease [Opitutales bacterium]MBT5167959.1 TRAP transporter large permease [Opitutales bacterium]MBT5813676.1 TRAP transporter large permease [Opitutales bacterium]MBT6379168.1 TRAP transporter large permease [Opitutales bacterium]MBT7866540.1 TRAP transporter large permease [Opitutales bacterium]
MIEVIFVLVVVFMILLVMNVPIAVAIAVASMLAMLLEGYDSSLMVASKMANGIDSFALLAIPFFILSGVLMGRGGMARRLMDLAATLVGRFPGGLGYVNTLTCMLFGSISGSAAAAVTSIGGFMLPEMKAKGYNNEFSVAITTTAATTGLLIPPSNIMIVYAVASGSVSIAAMFMAGVLPGILIGLLLMAVCFIIAKRTHLEAGDRSTIGEIWTAFRRAFFSMLLLVIVIGGILKGVFTATEASAIAVAYAFMLSVVFYREVKLTELPEILLQTGVTTAVIMLLIGASSGMSWIMTITNIPQTVSATLLGLSDNPLVIMLMINLLLLFVGTFMDMTPAVLIFTPIFLPIAEVLGIDPVHFGIILIANLCIGLCTPPVGTCLFLGCGVGKTTIARVTPFMIPFFIAMFIGLMLISYVPALSMWLPRVFGL